MPALARAIGQRSLEEVKDWDLTKKSTVELSDATETAPFQSPGPSEAVTPMSVLCFKTGRPL